MFHMLWFLSTLWFIPFVMNKVFQIRTSNARTTIKCFECQPILLFCSCLRVTLQKWYKIRSNQVFESPNVNEHRLNQCLSNSISAFVVGLRKMRKQQLFSIHLISFPVFQQQLEPFQQSIDIEA